jgi:hypothetical protein
VLQISLKFQLDDEQLTDWEIFCGKHAADSWWCDWQTLIYDRKSAANVPQIPGGVTDRHWSMIENLRHSCRRFLVVWLTSIDLWLKICGICAALIYDRIAAAFVPQIPGGVTDRRQTTDGRCNPARLHPQIGYIMWVHGEKGQEGQLDRVKTTMTGPDSTRFSQPLKFQVMGATTQHQCGTQI